MTNIKLYIQYDGPKYNGWQKQKENDNTIQGKIENVLSLMTGEDINLIASGRTDTGVHANMQVANFHTTFQGSTDEILSYCYEYLPKDIVVYDAFHVDERFHSRLNVKKKKYTYKICNKKFHDVFSRKYSYHVPETLDIEAMKEACIYLVGRHDFASFTAARSKKKSTVRTLYSIDIIKKDGYVNLVYLGSGFLHKMIRILTGTLIEVGLHNLKSVDVKNILKAEDRRKAGPTAPSQGLFMTSVDYE
ncbi:TPA: tRNA pseudouridine(38-40) synthase TruA [Clostridium botulinum]|nr:tRNA pseudouridine(38-40) synthase TruA [Clostridium botulinum]HCL4457223.1 tRNA pseudouridine(38-40) synthase TruA [Clostridium botulinum]HCL4460909.1 tRNA pseudouridine(38-40) synthase TruA [Clostridium botulinum]HCL4471966.1 tRNA pseudouridine(38-40) synthase TruA [Clostridium botulinum]HCL4475560.1 tRNA pseudouridine(38-40) synthase TruA [Clostridium botulinum]